MKRKQIPVIVLLLALLLTACDGQGQADGTASGQSAATQSAAASQAADASAASGKPLFAGAFRKDAGQVEPLEEEGDSAHQTMQVGLATITLGRFHTNHAAEAFLDDYGAGAFEVTEGLELEGEVQATHYRWRSGSNEDSTVNDAVLAESDGYCLLFLCQDSQDAFEGDAESGPDRATVEDWVENLTVEK